MALPKWLVPVGLVAAVAGGLAWVRKPSPKAGDTVGVHVGRLLDAAGNPAAFPITIPPSAKVALQVNFADGNQLRGDVVGYIDPSSPTVVRLNVPAGIGPFGFDKSAVTDLFREGKKIA